MVLVELLNMFGSRGEQQRRLALEVVERAERSRDVEIVLQTDAQGSETARFADSHKKLRNNGLIVTFPLYPGRYTMRDSNPIGVGGAGDVRTSSAPTGHAANTGDGFRRRVP